MSWIPERIDVSPRAMILLITAIVGSVLLVAMNPNIFKNLSNTKSSESSEFLVYILYISAAIIIGLCMWRLYVWLSARASEAQAKRLKARMLADAKAPLDTTVPALAANDESDAAVLSKFNELVEKMATKDYAFADYPLYLVIGEAGGGKSLAIEKSGIEWDPDFEQTLRGRSVPGNNTDEAEAARKGPSGTVGMEWWIGKRELIIDTAGKLHQHDGKGTLGNKAWDLLLQQLKRWRNPKRPINGVLVFVPFDTLSGKDSKKATAKDCAEVARHRLRSIQEAFGVRFPVWVIVSKSDLINGFTEYVNGCNIAGFENQMLGWTNPAKPDEEYKPEGISKDFEPVYERLARRRLAMVGNVGESLDDTGQKSCDTMPDVEELYCFPNELKDAVKKLEAYLEILLERPGGFHTKQGRKKASLQPLFLRGIYFTSASQGLSGFDRALKERLGKLSRGATRPSFNRRALFIKDLVGDRIRRETHLVTRFPHIRRAQLQRVFLFSGMFSLLGLLLIWFGLSVKKDIDGLNENYWKQVQLCNDQPIVKHENATTTIQAAPRFANSSVTNTTNHLNAWVKNLDEMEKKLTGKDAENIAVPIMLRPSAFVLGSGDTLLNGKSTLELRDEFILKNITTPVLKAMKDELDECLRSADNVNSRKWTWRHDHILRDLLLLRHGTFTVPQTVINATNDSRLPPMPPRPEEPIFGDWLVMVEPGAMLQGNNKDELEQLFKTIKIKPIESQNGTTTLPNEFAVCGWKDDKAFTEWVALILTSYAKNRLAWNEISIVVGTETSTADKVFSKNVTFLKNIESVFGSTTDLAKIKTVATSAPPAQMQSEVNKILVDARSVSKNANRLKLDSNGQLAKAIDNLTNHLAKTESVEGYLKALTEPKDGKSTLDTLKIYAQQMSEAEKTTIATPPNSTGWLATAKTTWEGVALCDKPLQGDSPFTTSVKQKNTASNTPSEPLSQDNKQQVAKFWQNLKDDIADLESANPIPNTFLRVIGDNKSSNLLWMAFENANAYIKSKKANLENSARISYTDWLKVQTEGVLREPSQQGREDSFLSFSPSNTYSAEKFGLLAADLNILYAAKKDGKAKYDSLSTEAKPEIIQLFTKIAVSSDIGANWKDLSSNFEEITNAVKNSQWLCEQITSHVRRIAQNRHEIIKLLNSDENKWLFISTIAQENPTDTQNRLANLSTAFAISPEDLKKSFEARRAVSANKAATPKPAEHPDDKPPACETPDQVKTRILSSLAAEYIDAEKDDSAKRGRTDWDVFVNEYKNKFPFDLCGTLDQRITLSPDFLDLKIEQLKAWIDAGFLDKIEKTKAEKMKSGLDSVRNVSNLKIVIQEWEGKKAESNSVFTWIGDADGYQNSPYARDAHSTTHALTDDVDIVIRFASLGIKDDALKKVSNHPLGNARALLQCMLCEEARLLGEKAVDDDGGKKFSLKLKGPGGNDIPIVLVLKKVTNEPGQK